MPKRNMGLTLRDGGRDTTRATGPCTSLRDAEHRTGGADEQPRHRLGRPAASMARLLVSPFRVRCSASRRECVRGSVCAHPSRRVSSHISLGTFRRRTNVCYSFWSPIDSILPYGGERAATGVRFTGHGVPPGQSGQSGEFTLTSTSGVTTAYRTVDSLVILVDFSPSSTCWSRTLAGQGRARTAARSMG